MRGSLWLLLASAVVFAAMMLATGLTFGFTLWNVRDPWPTILWIAVLAFPVLILLALKHCIASPLRLTLSFWACWSFVAFYFGTQLH